MTEQVENTVTSQLSAAIDATQTTITVDSGAIYPSAGDFRLRVEDELMLATARASNVITVTRGIEGTSGATHADESDVKMVHSAAALETIIDERIAASPAAVGRGVSCKVTSQVVAASSWVAMQWDTLLYETDSSMWDISSPGRWDVDKTGLWLATWTWWWVANVNGQRYHRIRVNGVVHTGEVDWLGMRTDNPLPYNTRSRVLDLTAGDYVQLQIYQTTTGNLNVAYAVGELTYLGSR